VHSNCGPLSANLHDRAHADCCQEPGLAEPWGEVGPEAHDQRLSMLSATLSSSLPGGNLRQWLKPDLPGGRYPRLRVFGPSSRHSLQPPDLGQDWAPANLLPTVFLRSLSVLDMRDYGTSQPSIFYKLPVARDAVTIAMSAMGEEIPGNYGRLSTPACATALASHAARTSGPALAGGTLARPSYQNTLGSGGVN
jgi:hypothetical protein